MRIWVISGVFSVFGIIIYLLDTGKLASLKFPTLWFENKHARNDMGRQ